MIILGLNAFHANSWAVLVQDVKLIGAVLRTLLLSLLRDSRTLRLMGKRGQEYARNKQVLAS